jgi:hypothetical protein
VGFTGTGTVGSEVAVFITWLGAILFSSVLLEKG